MSGTESARYSIWDADNQARTNPFTQFYQAISVGYRFSKGLNKAKNSLIKDVLHPEWANHYYWANLQFTGQELRFVH
jgi:CHAT domain-containing protein